MTHRGDTHALARAHQCVDDVRPAVGLARSRRSLERDEALVQVTDPTQDVFEIVDVDATHGPVSLEEPRTFAPEQRHGHTTGWVRWIKSQNLLGQVNQDTGLLARTNVIVESEDHRHHARLVLTFSPAKSQLATLEVDVGYITEAVLAANTREDHAAATHERRVHRLIGPREHGVGHGRAA